MKDKAFIGAALITTGLVAAMIGVFVFGNGSAPSAKNIDSGKLTGLQETNPPWKPESDSLSQRLSQLGLPAVGNESYHQHAILQIFINGQPVEVPNGIGQYGGGMSSLHTHDALGVVHIEAGQAYPFTLGQFFSVWGVKFTDNQLGAYRNDNDKTVQVYVNGEKVADPVNYQVKQKDKIVVGYGTKAQVPPISSAEFPKDL